MQPLWNIAHFLLASLESSIHLSVELHQQSWQITRFNFLTRASVWVEFNGMQPWFLDVLDLPFIHQNILSLEIKCIGLWSIRFPPSEGKEDIDTPESDFVMGVPSITENYLTYFGPKH
jgi:hypothetical protein